jgi:hypothetical protein
MGFLDNIYGLKEREDTIKEKGVQDGKQNEGNAAKLISQTRKVWTSSICSGELGKLA